MAEAKDALLVRLENGRTPQQIADLLLEEALRNPEFIVGLDFAFSFPALFCQGLNAKNVYEVWDQIAAKGEQLLSDCDPPFWGKPGRKRPSSGEPFRRTELDIAGNGSGAKPKSIFQIGGAGAVGTGSIRGMPVLKRLHDSGFSIWPFEVPAWPLVVEISPAYSLTLLRNRPRLAVKHTSPLSRQPWLRSFVILPPPMKTLLTQQSLHLL